SSTRRARSGRPSPVPKRASSSPADPRLEGDGRPTDRLHPRFSQAGRWFLMVRRLLVPALVTTGLVAGSFGTAHAATVSPATWAPKFCTAVTDYQTTISQDGESLTSQLENVTDLARGRDQIESFLGDMANAAKTAKRRIQSAGAPSTPNGE